MDRINHQLDIILEDVNRGHEILDNLVDQYPRLAELLEVSVPVLFRHFDVLSVHTSREPTIVPSPNGMIMSLILTFICEGPREAPEVSDDPFATVSDEYKYDDLHELADTVEDEIWGAMGDADTTIGWRAWLKASEHPDEIHLRLTLGIPS